MYEVYKEIEFDMGHRVYTQKLDETLALTKTCKCRHFHGHRYKIQAYIKSDVINNTGMVIDFTHYNYLKFIIDNFFDHKFMLSINDPLFEKVMDDITKMSHHDTIHIKYLTGSKINDEMIIIEKIPQLFDSKDIIALCPDLHDIMATEDIYVQEYINSFVFVREVPTAENIAVIIHKILSNILKDNNLNSLYCNKVVVYETPKSVAIYEPL